MRRFLILLAVLGALIGRDAEAQVNNYSGPLNLSSSFELNGSNQVAIAPAGITNAMLSTEGNFTLGGTTVGLGGTYGTSDNPIFNLNMSGTATVQGNITQTVSGSLLANQLTDYGTVNVDYPQFTFSAAGNTQASPTAIPGGGNALFGIYAKGYNGDGFSGNACGFEIASVDTFTPSQNGSEFLFYCAPTGTTIANNLIASLTGNGDFTLGNSNYSGYIYLWSGGSPSSETQLGAALATGTYTILLPATNQNDTLAVLTQPQELLSKTLVYAAADVAAEPSPLGNWNSVTTACTGNLSYVVSADCFSITGATTLTQPSSGYAEIAEAMPHPTYLYNSSGWNQDTGDNGGRTGAYEYFSHIYQAGQGDLGSFGCNGYVTGTRAGATQFLASPAIYCVAGTIGAGVAGAYLQGVGDFNLQDNGFDAAGIGLTLNLDRTVATGALNANWGGWNIQSKGAMPADWIGRGTGPARLGIDLASLTFPDATLTSAEMASGGAGYSAGDLLTPGTGTCDQEPTIKVLTVSGGVIATWGIQRSGLCSVAPSLPSAMSGGTGSGATFNLGFSTSENPILVSAANTYWYGNATQDTGVFSTSFPSTLKLGTSFFGYSGSLNAWNFVVGNASVLEISGSQVVSPVQLNAIGGLFDNGARAYSASFLPTWQIFTATSPGGIAYPNTQMVGLGATITPVMSGRVTVTISGDAYNAGAVGDGGTYGIMYGTGTPPANGAAKTGTAVVSVTPQFINASTAQKQPFSMTVVKTGLVAGTTYWFDLVLEPENGGTAGVEDVTTTLTEG